MHDVYYIFKYAYTGIRIVITYIQLFLDKAVQLYQNATIAGLSETKRNDILKMRYFNLQLERLGLPERNLRIFRYVLCTP